MGNNTAGLKAKSESLNNLMKQLLPGVTMLQETKLYKKGSMTFQNMCVFEKIRNFNEGGGLMTIVHENFKPVLIPMNDCDRGSENILVVQCSIGKLRIRFINAYGVQETASAEERSQFFSSLEQEIQFCINNGILLCLELDANAKVGDMIVNNHQVTDSPNGRILINIIERNNPILVHGTEKSSGIITKN